MESGINFKAIDFIKIGSVLLHNGNWNEQHIINQEWLEQSIFSEFPLSRERYEGTVLDLQNIGYQYMWYSLPTKNDSLDFFAGGKYGQYLYVSPENNVVILRTGKAAVIDSWPELFKELSIDASEK